jgi:hypothetical protein
MRFRKSLIPQLIIFNAIFLFIIVGLYRLIDFNSFKYSDIFTSMALFIIVTMYITFLTTIKDTYFK